MNEFITARIIQVNRGQFAVRIEDREYRALLSGRLKHDGTCPVVGDYVQVQITGPKEVIIHRLLERTSYLSRPDGGGHADCFVKTYTEQAMAANLDFLFVITSLNDDFSLNRIARFASTAIQGGCRPVIVLTKADLCPDKAAFLSKVRQMNGQFDAVCVSAVTGEGIEEIRRFMRPGITIGLMGSSGVGKSTLINTLAGHPVMKVSDIRQKDAKGRHTTTHRQLLEIDGAFLIDTPGMREFGLCDVANGIEETFSDIAQLVQCCRFSDCSHTKEPGCAVRSALEKGTLSSERWALFRSLLAESNRSRAMSARKKIALQKKKAGL